MVVRLVIFLLRSITSLNDFYTDDFIIKYIHYKIKQEKKKEEKVFFEMNRVFF